MSVRGEGERCYEPLPDYRWTPADNRQQCGVGVSHCLRGGVLQYIVVQLYTRAY